jgi:hypothetical protein
MCPERAADRVDRCLVGGEVMAHSSVGPNDLKSECGESVLTGHTVEDRHDRLGGYVTPKSQLAPLVLTRSTGLP